MKKYLDLRNAKEYASLKDAAKTITEGGLVLFPTETVYGIGADGLNEKAVKNIFIAKGRASDNPLILHVSNFEMVERIAKDISPLEYKLMDAFWPGPFTIILKKKDIVPSVVTGGLDTVAVRFPSNKIVNKLIEYSNTPIAAPSANISGRPSGTCLEDIFDELSPKMDYVINGGRCEVGLESTVVKVEESGEVRILRPGKITKEQIEEVAQSVILDSHIFGMLKDGEKVLSPGMKYKHYAPETRCVLVYSKDNEKMIQKITGILEDYKNAVVICNSQNVNRFKQLPNTQVLDYGQTKEDIAKNIFTLLRKVDTLKVNSLKPEICIIEGIEKEGIGLAIMNRLIRACSHEYIEIE